MGNGSGDPYKYPDVTAGYIVKWITGAKQHYGLDIDYIGVCGGACGRGVRWAGSLLCAMEGGVGVIVSCTSPYLRVTAIAQSHNISNVEGRGWLARLRE